MATKNFTQFSTTTLTTGDYVVGFKQDGSAEFKSQVKDIVNLVQDSDAQTLSFNESNKDLAISFGNTVSLSSLSDTAFATASSSFATNTTLNSVSSLLTPLTLTNTLTSQLVTNTIFNDYQTSVSSSTAALLPTSVYQSASGSFATNTTLNAVSSVLLPTSIYQSASGNWEATYSTFSSSSAFNIQSRSTLETPTTGLSTINNIVSLSQATYDALTVKLSATLYIIV